MHEAPYVTWSLLIMAADDPSSDHDASWRDSSMSDAVGVTNLHCLHTLRHPRGVRGVAFSPDRLATRLATAGGSDGAARVWDSTTGQHKLEIKVARGRTVDCASYSHDGKLLAIAGNDLLIVVYKTSNGCTRPALKLQGHTGKVLCVSFSPKCDFIASGSEDGTIILWNPLTGNRIAVLDDVHSNYVRSIAFSPNGAVMVTGGDDGAIVLWDPATKEPIQKLHTESGGGVMEVAYSPNGSQMAIGCDDGTACMWGMAGPYPEARCRLFDCSAKGLAFSPCGAFLVTGSGDGKARVWDSGSGSLVAVTATAHANRLTGVSFSSCGSLMATSSLDRTAKIWSFGKSIGSSGAINGAAPAGESLCKAARSLPKCDDDQCPEPLIRPIMSSGKDDTSTPNQPAIAAPHCADELLQPSPATQEPPPPYLSRAQLIRLSLLGIAAPHTTSQDTMNRSRRKSPPRSPRPPLPPSLVGLVRNNASSNNSRAHCS